MNAHPEYMPSFLELLNVLPQEAFHHKIIAHPEKLPDIQISRSMEGGQVPHRGETSKSNFHSDEHEGDQLRKSSDDTGNSETEQILKGKTFSKDDLNCWAELLQSRIDDDHEKRSQDVTRKENEESLGTSTDERLALSLHRDVDEVMNSRPEATAPIPVSASPIDLAKAYMGARTLEPGFSSHSLMLKDEGTPLPVTGFSSISSIFSTAPKSVICWPGARAGSDRPLNISSTQWKQSQTCIYIDKQVTRTRIPPREDGFGSVGPNRRIHCRYGTTTPSTGTSLSRHASSSPSWAEITTASKSFAPIFKEKLESGASTSSNMKILPGTSNNISAKFLPTDVETPSSNIGISTVHPQSCGVARKILENLDRNMPTPQKRVQS